LIEDWTPNRFATQSRGDVGSAPKAYAIHMGLSERDARDTAVSQRAAGDRKVAAAFTDWPMHRLRPSCFVDAAQDFVTGGSISSLRSSTQSTSSR
ncbi:hypothetical protein, partial [Stenotrophomonas indicatrix]|uniref:hypothetical protein n=1 Tax=Stenotrophomonas indicatrix TaxID=2045451 RepID=UPI00289F21ED